METSPVLEWYELEQFFEQYILTETREEETKNVLKELISFSDETNIAENYNTTSDALPSSSAPSVPPADPKKPVALTFLPQIHNVFFTAKLGCKLDLRFIAKKVWNTEYKPEAFRALTMRIRKPRCTGRLFQSGTLVCAGTKSVDEAHQAARKFARIVQKLGFPVRLQHFKICNIVTCCKFFPVHLKGIQQAYDKQCSFNPEICSYLFFRGIPGITATIFHTGDVILNRVKRVDEIQKAFDVIYPILSRFRKQ